MAGDKPRRCVLCGGAEPRKSGACRECERRALGEAESEHEAKVAGTKAWRGNDSPVAGPDEGGVRYTPSESQRFAEGGRMLRDDEWVEDAWVDDGPGSRRD